MDIYQLLKSDHDKVKKMLASLEKKKDLKLFKELKQEVIAHAEAEEEAFYEPLQSKAGELKIMVKTGHKEHDLTMDMLKRLDKIEDDEGWMSLFAVIKKSLEAHILMEEEDIFDLAKKHFSSLEAKEIATNMTKLKKDFLKDYEA